MKIFDTIGEWRDFRAALHAPLGFVPTMGALHAGHASLVQRSVNETAHTLVSIFVNPTQFNDPNDLQHYPRTLEADIALLRSAGAQYLLLPDYDALYADGYRYRITENSFSRQLCGKHRPGHFDGVLTVVMKLLQLAKAQRAYFGEKDYQQFRLIQDMAQAFFLDTEIIPCPTVREEDGLALSSRNSRLNAEERHKAPLIFKALRDNNRQLLEYDGFKVDYFEEHDNRLYAAATLGSTRLIDNIPMGTRLQQEENA